MKPNEKVSIKKSEIELYLQKSLDAYEKELTGKKNEAFLPNLLGFSFQPETSHTFFSSLYFLGKYKWQDFLNN